MLSYESFTLCMKSGKKRYEPSLYEEYTPNPGR